MKKLVLSLLLIILTIPTFLFVGCKDDNSINMSSYFNSEVSFITYDKVNTKQTASLNKFTGQDKTYRQYTSLTFTGNTWLYRMNVEKISFNICSNMNMDFELKITISNLKNGNNSSIGGNSVFTKVIPLELTKGKIAHISIYVNDFFAAVSSTSEIKITPTDSTCFYKNGQKTNFSYYINNFMLYGSH